MTIYKILRPLDPIFDPYAEYGGNQPVGTQGKPALPSPGTLQELFLNGTDGSAGQFTVAVNDLVVLSAERESEAHPSLDLSSTTATYTEELNVSTTWKGGLGADGSHRLVVYKITSISGGSVFGVSNNAPDQCFAMWHATGGVNVVSGQNVVSGSTAGSFTVSGKSLPSAPSGRTIAFVSTLGARTGGYDAAQDTMSPDSPWVYEGTAYNDQGFTFNTVHAFSTSYGSNSQTIEGTVNGTYDVSFRGWCVAMVELS